MFIFSNWTIMFNVCVCLICITIYIIMSSWWILFPLPISRELLLLFLFWLIYFCLKSVSSHHYLVTQDCFGILFTWNIIFPYFQSGNVSVGEVTLFSRQKIGECFFSLIIQLPFFDILKIFISRFQINAMPTSAIAMYKYIHQVISFKCCFAVFLLSS